MKIAVDLDNTLTKEDVIKDWWNSKPCESNEKYKLVMPQNAVIKYINDLFLKGHEIIIYTARDRAYRQTTIEWLEKNKVLYSDIMFNKLHFDYLLDDKATNTLFGLKLLMENDTDRLCENNNNKD